MKDGFIRVAAATPKAAVADCIFNANETIELMKEADRQGAKLVVFPELGLTGYTCGELFLQNLLLDGAKEALAAVAKASEPLDVTAVVGLPMMMGGKLYNTAAVVSHGSILGFVPKKHIPNYSEFYEKRYFAEGFFEPMTTSFNGQEVPFGINLLFEAESMPEFKFAVEICEDLWVAAPPSTEHTAAGALVIANLSASDEVTGKDSYRRQLVSSQSARLVSGYIYADAGEGESTTDLVFAGRNMIAENGRILKASERFTTGLVTADLDLEHLISERRRMTTYVQKENPKYRTVYFPMKKEELQLQRFVDATPFIPHGEHEREERCEEILTIQAYGLKKRLAHTNSQYAVVGISGGLDSTLALLVTARAFDMLHIPRRQIIAVTMPCFGTTDRTYNNACMMVKKLDAVLEEVDIRAAVTKHFEDIGHDIDVHDVTFENAQARERTQVLMDIANKVNGMVIGTGDMSELALGWATYNGDHMSMYGVNASVPKTLVRHLVRYWADTCGDEALSKTLYDVLDTPVSPELIPPKDGEIAQKTEDLVGPYELHDFYMYYILRFGYTPSKIFRLACIAFDGIYDKKTIYKWLRTFCWRFFAQQFKRSCLPDGPKVGSVALSPRGDLRLPSDASSKLWMRQLDEIEAGL